MSIRERILLRKVLLLAAILGYFVLLTRFEH